MSLSFFSRKKEEEVAPTSKTVQMSSPSPWASASSPSPWVNQSSTQKPTSYFPKPAWQTPTTQKKSAFTPAPQVKKPVYQVPGTPTPLNPNYKPAPQQQQQQTDPMSNYIAKLRAIADERKGLYKDSATEQQLVMDAVNERNQQRLREQEGRLVGAKDRSVASMKGYMDDLTARAEEDRIRAEDEAGATQKKSIQAGREEQARLQNLFGDLGSIDSSVFQDQAIKAEQRGTERFRDIDKMKMQEIQEIDRTRRAGLAEAESALYEIESNFADQIAYINDTMIQGSEQHKLAVNQLWRDTQDAILQLSDSVTQMEMEQAQKLAEAGASQLSEGFLTSGQPQTRADYEWMINNRDKYDQSFVNQGQVNAQKQDLLSLVNQAKNSDLGVLSGAWGKSGIGTLWGSGLETKALIDQIKNKLTVEAREKLRGQGQISDKETEMLANSVSKLQPGMTQEGLKAELLEIENILNGKYRYDGGQSPNVVTAPDGQQIILVD
jgi:hypothetical protein